MSIHCSYCNKERPYEGSEFIDKLTRICAQCNKKWLEEIKKDKYAEDLAEQRRESMESRRDREP